MTKEEILQKIGERIAALSHNASQMCEEYEGYRLACLDISDVLDEIEKELSQHSLPSNLDEAAEKFAHFYDNGTCDGVAQECFKAGAEWMAGQGWHDATETPSIFGFYLVIHEKGWCVANYMGKGVVCESGWVEAIHHIEIEHPQKWLDLRDLIPKKQ